MEENEEIQSEKNKKLSMNAMVTVSILDAYFTNRMPVLPEETDNQAEYQPEHKSTADIVEDLSDMVEVDPSVVRLYMYSNGYKFITGEDGCVRWAIWRRMLL